MKETLELVRATILAFVRSKTLALAVILGPLLVILVAGLALDTSQLPGVSVGVHAESRTPLADSFIASLAKNQFRVTHYADGESCVDSLKQGVVHTCIEFPEGFSIEQSNEITFYVDYSKLTLVWTLLQVMTSRTQEHTLQMSQNLTGQVLDALATTENQLKTIMPMMVKLATENDYMLKDAEQIDIELAELDLSYNHSGFRVGELKRAKTMTGQWVDTALKNGQEALHQAERFVGLAKETVANEDVSSGLAETLKDIAELRSRMDTTRERANVEFKELSSLIDNIVGKLQRTEGQLTAAESARNTAVESVIRIQRSIQLSVLYLLTVQNSLDTIDRAVTGIEIRDSASISNPFVTSIKPVVARASPLNYSLPTLIMLVIALTALFIAPTLVHQERHSPTMKRVRASLPPLVTVMTTAASCTILVGIQAILALLVAIVFGAAIWKGIIWSVGIIIGISLVSSSIGLLIGYSIKREDIATLTAICVGLIMIVLSDLLVPLEAMPAAIRLIAQLNPINFGSELMRQALFGLGAKILPGILKLILYVLVVASITVLVWGRQQRIPPKEWI